MKSKNINNIIAVLAVIVVAVAVINVLVTFVKFSGFEETLTGYATGYVNITISSNVEINLTNSSVDFGAGGVNATGCSRATLTTRGGALPTIVCGNWSTHPSTGSPHAIVIENNGNVNCTVIATGTNDAAALIGGTGPVYKWNVTMLDSGSCSGSAIGFNVWADANSTAKTLCTDFSSLDSSDELRLDVNLSIPNDATVGIKADTITIAASAQG